MAKVKLHLRGGPYDEQTVVLEVLNVDDPPEKYHLKLHGPHEAVEIFEYRRGERDPAGGADTWIYEASDGDTR